MVKLWVISVWWLHVVLFNAAGDYMQGVMVEVKEIMVF